MSWLNFLDKPITVRPKPPAPAVVAKPVLSAPKAMRMPRKTTIDFIAILKRVGEPMTQSDLAFQASCSVVNVCLWFQRYPEFIASQGVVVELRKVNGRTIKFYSIAER